MQNPERKGFWECWNGLLFIPIDNLFPSRIISHRITSYAIGTRLLK